MNSGASTATNRVRLRFALLAASAILLLVAFVSFALLGMAWAVAPFSLAILSCAVAIGRMSRRSFAFFVSDLRAIIVGSSAGNLASYQADAVPAKKPVPAETRPDDGGGANDVAEARIPASARTAQGADVSAPEAEYASPPVLRWEKSFGIAVLIAGLLSAALSLYMFSKGPPNTLAWWSFGLSVLLLLGAVPAFERGWSAFFARFRSGYLITFEPRALLPWAALGVIVLLALFIRLYNIDGFPPGLWFDEADNLDKARQIAEDPGYLPVFVPFTELPSLFLLPIAVVIEFAGVSMTTGRLVAAAFGIAGVVAIFLMVRQMSGIGMGLVAAFLTAVMRWDIIWSRTGMHGITAPFFAALTAWLTYRAVQNGSRSSFALAGAALGLGMWYYAAYRLFPLVIGFVLVHVFLSEKGVRKRLLGNVCILALFAAIVTLPLIQFVASHPEEFFRRTEVTSVFSQSEEGETWRTIGESLSRHLGMFHIEGDPNGRHNLPRAPMLDIFSGLLMLVGLAVAVFRWRDAAFIVLPFWVFVMIMPGVLTIPWEAPQSLRTITVIPAVIALIAIGIGFIWNWGRSARLPAVKTGVAGFVAVLLAAIAYTNINGYFGEQANNPEVYASYSTDETLMARDLAEQAEKGYSPMVSRQFRHSLVASLFGHRFPRQTIAAPTNIPLDSQLVWRGAAIYIEPRESGFYDALRAYYPTASFREVTPPGGGEVLYYTAYVSREQLEAAQGLLERRISSGGEVVESVKRRTESAWTLEAGADDVPFDVEWSGALHITHPGEYVLALEGGSSASVLLDGIPILSEERLEVTIEPAVGLHSLQLRSKVRDTDGVLRLLWQPPPSPLEEGEQDAAEELARERVLEPISASNLYHGDIRPVGLVGRFFKAVDDPARTDGEMPDATQVTPGVGGAFWYHSVVGGAHLAVWDGTLNVPESGPHRFGFGEVHGEMRMIIDGSTVIDTQADSEAELELLAGKHRIRLEYTTDVGSPWFELLWTRPGKPESRLEPAHLTPAPEYMFRVLREE